MAVTRSPREATEAYFDAINGERYDEVARLFAADGVLCAPGTKPRVGHDEIADYFRAALAPYPDHRDDPTRIVVADRTVTVEIHFSGKVANGAPLEFDAVDVFDYDDEGLIVKLTSWYDSHRVRRHLTAALGEGS
jgi:ketosteroid isomerase-like protein